MRRMALVFFGLLAAASVAIAEPSTKKPIIITHGGGGIHGLDDSWFQHIYQSDRPVQLHGVCKSSCTRFLRIQQDRICVTPKAELWFHLAGFGPLWDSYPPKIQDWLSRRNSFGLEYVVLKGKELQRFYPLCAK